MEQSDGRVVYQDNSPAKGITLWLKKSGSASRFFSVS